MNLGFIIFIPSKSLRSYVKSLKHLVHSYDLMGKYMNFMVILNGDWLAGNVLRI